MVIPKLNKAIEVLTGYLGTISSDHAYVHKGIAYTAVHTTASISAAYDICFKTPTVASGKYIHWRPIGITSSANYVGWQLTETETYTGGTGITPINRNRNVTTASAMQAFVYNATCTPTGTKIAVGGVGTAGNPTAVSGGGSGADQEIVLKPNTIYAMTLTPGGATVVNLELFWYEEDGYVA